MRTSLQHRGARAVALLALLGCSVRPQGDGQLPGRVAQAPRFSPPASVDACRPDRLTVLEAPLDAGAPYSESEWLPVEYALDHHSYATEELVLIFVPEVDYRQNALAVRGLRFDVAKGQWLPAARHELNMPRGLAPRYADVASGPVGTGYVVTWEDRVLQRTHGLFFTPSNGTFRDASASEVAARPSYNGLATQAAPPPDPDPTTGVSVNVDYPGQKATFSRGTAALGTVRFPTMPGAYIGAFPSTRTAFFWDQSPRAEQARLPPSQQRLTYLVHLESGATCRIERDLVYPVTAVFRRRGFIAFVNAHRNEVRPSDCPPGAPCVAPEQSHFERASLVVFRDGG